MQLITNFLLSLISSYITLTVCSRELEAISHSCWTDSNFLPAENNTDKCSSTLMHHLFKAAFKRKRHLFRAAISRNSRGHRFAHNTAVNTYLEAKALVWTSRCILNREILSAQETGEGWKRGQPQPSANWRLIYFTLEQETKPSSYRQCQNWLSDWNSSFKVHCNPWKL